MFRRKRKPETLSDKEIAYELAVSEEEKIESEKELAKARDTVSVLNEIRKENHIVHDLREVFGGR